MKKTKRIIILSLVIVILLSLSAMVFADTYRVSVKEAKVFAAKDNTLDPIAALKGPAKVEVVEVDGDWASVILYHWAMVDGVLTRVETPGFMRTKDLSDSLLAAEGMTSEKGKPLYGAAEETPEPPSGSPVPEDRLISTKPKLKPFQ